MISHKIYSTCSNDFQSFIEPDIRATRTLVSKSSSYELPVSHRALPLITYLYNLKRACQTLFSNPHFIALINQNPRLLYKYLGNYLARNFSKRDRLSIVINHYYFLSKHAKPGFFASILRETVIWSQCINELNIAIKIKFPVGIDFDGDLTLVFEMDDNPIYAVSFTFIPTSLIDGSSNQAIFVGRVQGTAEFDLIKKATKSLSDITPAALLIAALQGVGTAFNIDKIIGISNERHLYRYTRDSKQHFFDYDSFWSSFNVEKENGFFHLPIPFPEKPLSSLKPNHRSRTVRKRAYKKELSMSIADYCRGNLLLKSE